jgi:hypothetical protein
MRHGGRDSSPSFPALLFRSFASMLALGAVLAAAVLHSASAVDARAYPRGGPVPWKESWSERYPGCVSVLLWPQDERPVAVVARRPDGSVTRLTVRGPRPFDSVPSGVRAVGACR